MSQSESHTGVVACQKCELHVPVTDPNEAIEVFRRHKRVTSHEIDWERTAINFTASSAETESVLLNLEDRFPEGVPVGILTAALHDQGVSISEVLEDLYDLRMNGEIYEPIDDHYRVL